MSARIPFGSKAETLERLDGLVTTAQVLPQFRLTAADWMSDRAAVLAALDDGNWLSRTVIVRSSACGEDSREASHAGEFASIPRVHGADSVAGAVEQVFASYTRRNRADQVFIQPQLEAVKWGGVAFGLDPNTGGPYVVVNCAGRHCRGRDGRVCTGDGYVLLVQGGGTSGGSANVGCGRLAAGT